ncbi:hypothetical protein [Mycobacterium sp. 3-98]|uniref:hypothetical protein n=1 Tax=Mycobacterium sp. 3-98 TaxID=3042317 RepID=UPI002DD965C3|nr:hypothetical protein [Mycobacterium sp. 3-98]WSE46438.1 hypothetical protein QGN30_00210 [Mycobacterium sp. 3-98]
MAAELNIGIQEVVRRCNGSLFEDEHGMRQVPGHIFRELKDERDARWAAERETARQRRENRQPNPVRERVRAIQEAQREIPPNAFTYDDSMPAKAVATLLAPTGPADYDERTREADERTDDFMNGTMQIRKIGPVRVSRKRNQES